MCRSCDHDLDPVRLVGRDAVALDRLHLAGAAAVGLLQRLAGVVPAAQVPPEVVARPARGEPDEEALGTRGLAGVELERVVAPVLLVGAGGDAAGVGDGGARLHVLAVHHRPVAGLRGPGGGVGEVVLEQHGAAVVLGHADVVVGRRGGPGGQEHSAVQRLRLDRRGGQRAGHHLVADVVREQVLDPVVGAGPGLVVVEPDGVRRPLHVRLVGQQRRVGRELHQVAVALQTGHVRGLGQAVPPGVPARGVLAEEHVRTLAVVGVVALGVGQEPARVVVVVLVDQVHVLLTGEVPEGVEPGAGVVRTRVGDDLHVRVGGRDRVPERREVGLERGGVLLVAEPDVRQLERLGVTERGALGAPGGGHVARRELDEVERVLHPAGDLRRVGHLRDRAPAAVGADRQHGQRDGPEVLGQLHVLQVADAVGLVVAPEVPVGGPLLDRPDGLLPLVGAAPVGVPGLLVGAERADVGDAAAGEAQEGRVERGDLLREVLAQHGRAVHRSDPRVLREQGHLVEVERGGRAGEDDEPSRVGGGARGQRDLVLLPDVRAVDVDGAGRDQSACRSRRPGSALRRGGAHPDARVVGRSVACTATPAL